MEVTCYLLVLVWDFGFFLLCFELALGGEVGCGALLELYRAPLWSRLLGQLGSGFWGALS